jgi:hypothetical protein
MQIPQSYLTIGYLDIKALDVVPVNRSYLEHTSSELLRRNQKKMLTSIQSRGNRSVSKKRRNSGQVEERLPNVDIKPTTASPKRIAPRFELNQVVNIPIEVVEGKKARIVAYEWGEDNKGVNGTRVKCSSKSWVYLLVEMGEWDPLKDRKRWYASEEELIRWNQ